MDKTTNFGIEHLRISLQNLDFSEKESNVYIALLTLGKGTVSEISRKAGINRTTGYDILGYLAEKGLISISGKEPRQEYIAESPTKITEYLKKQILDTEVKINTAEQLVSDLALIYKHENRPKIRFYEGEEGLKNVYEDTLNSNVEILAYASVEDVHTGIDNYFPEYFKRRAKKGIPIRAIFPKTPLAVERKSYDEEEKRQSLLIPADKYSFSPEINIYNNKIMIASWREKLGIIIESAEIADAMKKIYELAWVRAKELDADANKTTGDII